ncbi:MAG: 16S rRNA (cytidine(1402)-2'-O)-methyltransferase [Candidatus Peribacteraceae bacterium]|nr:16S rRNA (cytidine(1402)-2'-O)-methyltransferase [Candidatus Peribacteraceae bacterium]MDD5742380.1 16S rRNA (cytidine(1402)-2'-O)-methyltransferase [Candidatus Peribacteraceae bacterium]
MLSIVSTPIGNLGDITLRALETLKKCDAVVCEDTRVTGQLLKLLNLEKKELISCHGYSDPKKVDDLIRRLKDGRHLVLVSDAGTPGISDPGYALVSRARGEGIPIEVIPGPAAFLAALSASGLPINRFVYLGFLPMKKGRQTLLKSFTDEERTIVFYESVHRIGKTLDELAEALKEQPERPVVIARELTKMHEEIVSTTAANLPLVAQSVMKKGEFVVVVGAR